MAIKDPRIDAYIKKSAPFAQPILTHFRALVHKACPDVEETMKWSFPHFNYKGAMMCSAASFKQHCSVGFWKAALLKDPSLIENAKAETSMGHLGRITSLKDLPTDRKILSLIKEAMQLNEKGIKVKKVKKSAKSPEIPAYFLEALKTNMKADIFFQASSNSCKREYIDWIEEAKTEATRTKRIKQSIEWLAESKQRNWKYM